MTEQLKYHITKLKLILKENNYPTKLITSRVHNIYNTENKLIGIILFWMDKQKWKIEQMNYL